MTVFNFIYIDRRIEYNYTKYGDSPACVGEELDLSSHEKVYLQGFGIQPVEEQGELLELELNLIPSNEKCYEEFIKVDESIPEGIPSKKISKTPGNFRIRQALYDGITDQLLCTKITLNKTTAAGIDFDRNCKIVSQLRIKVPFPCLLQFS